MRLLLSLLAARVGWGTVVPAAARIAMGHSRMGFMGRTEGMVVSTTCALLLSFLALKRVTYSRSRWADEFITGATEAWMNETTDEVSIANTPTAGQGDKRDPSHMHFGDFPPDAAALATATAGVADTAEGRAILEAHLRTLMDVEGRMRRVESSLSSREAVRLSTATAQRSLTAFQREWLYAAKLEFPICKINVAQRATVASFLRSKIKLAHPDMRQTDLWMHVSRITTAYFIPTAEEILQAQVLRDPEVVDRVRLAALPEA